MEKKATNERTPAAGFTALDLGTGQPTSVPMEVVEVTISISDLVADFAKSFVDETYRKNTLRAQSVGLTGEEITRYCEYLLSKRIEIVNNNCKDFRVIKVLSMPSFIQYCLSMVGEVVKRDVGLTMKPVLDKPSDMTLDEAIAISKKIDAFSDVLQIVTDAMPRDRHGNDDVMSSALLAGYVRSMKKVDHVASTYVVAFMDMKLRQETAFSALYRVQYDDINYIASALTSAKGLF